jgi:hypothetical protein
MNWAARAAAIADGSAAWLNDPAREWTGRFTATRTWAPKLSFEALDQKLYCDVVPILESADDLMNRALKQQDYTTLLCWRQRYTPASGAADDDTIPNDFADGLVAFVEDVADKLIDVSLPNQPAGIQRVFCLRREVDLSFVGAALLDKRAFMAFTEVVWREVRTR